MYVSRPSIPSLADNSVQRHQSASDAFCHIADIGVHPVMVGDQSQGQMDDAQSPELASASGSTMHVGHEHGSDHQSSSEGHPNVADLDPVCGGCKQAIDQESGGVVVAFGLVQD